MFTGSMKRKSRKKCLGTVYKWVAWYVIYTGWRMGERKNRNQITKLQMITSRKGLAFKTEFTTECWAMDTKEVCYRCKGHFAGA